MNELKIGSASTRIMYCIVELISHISWIRYDDLHKWMLRYAYRPTGTRHKWLLKTLFHNWDRNGSADGLNSWQLFFPSCCCVLICITLQRSVMVITSCREFLSLNTELMYWLIHSWSVHSIRLIQGYLKTGHAACIWLYLPHPQESS
jgi:hypothetical protein